MDKFSFDNLIEKVSSGEASDEELAQYNALMNRLTGNLADWGQNDPVQAEAIRQELWSHIESDLTPVRRISYWPRYVAAASAILLLGVGGYLYLHKTKPVIQTAQLIKHDVPPGHQQATLTLANGQKILLTKGLSGQLATQNQTAIKVNQNNIVYQQAAQSAGEEIYNTLSTAIGEQSPFPLVLEDGTKVWLNAASSITFPVAFNGKERLVKVTGEAYFEVMHKEHQPFKVQTATETVEDIGTRFNINSYDDEPAVKTTLVEGAVRVQAGNPTNNIDLAPGQQAQLSVERFTVKTVNTARVTAWKDGNFRFQNDDIQTIMRQLARWYNIEVRYQGPPPVDKFSGRISRRSPISAVLHMMESTNHVHFKIEGRRVTVMR